MENPQLILFNNVRYCYGEVCAVEGVNFHVNEKTITALVGPNGGGKSTLLKITAGLLKPGSGSISSEHKINIGYVSQNHGIDISFPITVKEIVLSGTLKEGVLPFAKYSALQKDKAISSLEKVGLSDFLQRGVNQLSGGQLKRVLIARALASDASIIVLDEPDSSLDIDATKKLYEILINLKSEKTIIIASHNVETILEIADTALYVNRSVDFYNTPSQLKDKIREGIII
jgi:zinc transport system ATP-binding protein